MATGPESRDRVEELLLEALELDTTQREALLVRLRHEEPSLAAALEDALRGEDATTFLQPPEPPTWPEVDASPAMDGRQLGSCRLIRPIGEGGMGVVYEAVQPTLGRKVAVKLLKSVLREDAQARFEYEIRLLARLEHPGIAQVHESGVLEAGAAPQPWFAMEFVEGGRPLDAWAREEKLDVRARVELMLEVCDAIAYAHQRGVIHRDLKPANVLVDGDGRIRVIDFGVARGLEDGDGTRPFQTLAGGAVGTLRYMSPEQAAGRQDEVDVRTDVYALGVILFQLVCGRHPRLAPGEDFGMIELLHVLSTREPVRPSQVLSGISPDLEAILLQALRQERDRRYSGVAAFADDLRAWLAGRSVSARVPSRGERFRYWIRRNRAVASAAAMAVTALVTGSIVSLMFALDAEAARESEKVRAERAEQRLAASRDLARWVTHDLQQRLAPIPGTLALREELVRRVVENLDALATGETDPELQQALVEGYVMAASIQGSPTSSSLGNVEAALTSLEKAQSLADGIAARDPSQRNATRLGLLSRLQRADLLTVSGRLDDAEELYRFSLERIPDLETGAGHDEGLLSMRRQAHRGLAMLASLRGEPEKLYEHGRAASAAARLVWENDPDDDELAARAIVETLATVRDLEGAGRLDEANDELDLAETILDGFEVDDDKVARVRGAWQASRASLLEAEGELDEAGSAYRRAARILDRIHRDHPRDAPLAHDYSAALIGAGNVAWKQGRADAADDLFSKNLDLRRRIIASAGPSREQRRHLAYGMTRLILLRLAAGRIEAALELMDEAEALVDELVAAGDDSILALALDVKKARGHVPRTRSRAPNLTGAERSQLIREAIAAYRRALAFLRERHPHETPAHLRPVENQIAGWVAELESEGG